MAFWGIGVKPGKPYTHSSKDGRGRLRISQATLANGSAPKKSLVQCNVGDKSPVLLCALLPDKTESLQLDLEFEEAEDVIFSVIGPRGVYLTGYFVGHNRPSNMQDDTESYGEDIANSETQESNQNSDEDEYEDSFINDDEPDPLTPSTVSSSRDDDDGECLKKIRNDNGGCKRLKKKYQFIESDDEMSVQEIDDEDHVPISSICKNKKSEASGKKPNKETTVKLDKKTKNNEEAVDFGLLDSVDDETKIRKGGQPNMPMPLLAEVVPENKSKQKNRRQEFSTEDNEANFNNANNKSLLEVVATEDSKKLHESLLSPAPVLLNEGKTKKKKRGQSKKENTDKVEAEDHIKHDTLAAKDDQKPNDMVVVDSLEMLCSAAVVLEKKFKAKKKRKGRDEVNADGADNNLLAGNKQEDDQQAIDKNSGIASNHLANGDQSEEKKVKKKRRKTSKTQGFEENTKKDIVIENKSSSAEPELKDKSESSNKTTLSNGLVVEDLVMGNSKGREAAIGRKVKVQYIVKLKENGQIIDSNGKSPHKFRLGDKEVIEGLNAGLEGMRAGDERRLTVPPSMSLGYKGTGENVPPNSWLVFDVEMTRVH